MNHPTRCLLLLGIALLLSALALAAILNPSSASASPQVQAVFAGPFDSAQDKLSDLALQPPPPPISWTLTVNSNPVAGGSVTQNPPRPSTGKYLSGTVVALTAVPASGYKFDNWTIDGNTVSANPTNVTMTADHSATAHFSLLSIPTATATATASRTATRTVTPPQNATLACYTLSTAVSPGVGVVTINTVSNCGGGNRYTSGTSVNLTATANDGSGYTFDRWDGCNSTSGASCTAVMSANKRVTAYFVPVSQPTSTPIPTSEPPVTPLFTITPLVGGVVPTVTPLPTPSSGLPSTGASPLGWLAAGIVLVLIVLGARYMRRSSV